MTFPLATAVAAIIVVVASLCAAEPVFVGVQRSTAELATNSQRGTFATSIVAALANQMIATGLPPTPEERASLMPSLGSVSTVDVAEVNDTFTNVQLDCELATTADAIIEAANVLSWNPVKSTGISIASKSGPTAETQGARTVVFFAIVTIVAVVCAGIASWYVRRRAIEKHRGISFTELAGRGSVGILTVGAGPFAAARRVAVEGSWNSSVVSRTQ